MVPVQSIKQFLLKVHCTDVLNSSVLRGVAENPIKE